MAQDDLSEETLSDITINSPAEYALVGGLAGGLIGGSTSMLIGAGAGYWYGKNQ